MVSVRKVVIVIVVVVVALLDQAATTAPPGDIFLGSGECTSTVWSCVVNNNRQGHGIECFLPSDANSNDGVYSTTGILAGDYKQVSLSAGYDTGDVWACASKTDGSRIDCFLPSSHDSEGIEMIGSVAGNYGDFVMAGWCSASDVWACAPTTDGSRIDCFLPYYSNDSQEIEVRGSLVGDYRDLVMAVAGGIVWACASKTDGSQIDCFAPGTGFEIWGSIAGDYRDLFMVGGDCSICVWVCASRTDGSQIDCFFFNSFNESLFFVGDYRDLFMAKGKSTEYWVCASKTDGSQIDCFVPTPYNIQGEIEVRGSIAGDYRDLVMAGSGSTVWACASRTDGSQIDCFVPSSCNSEGIEVIGSVAGNYRDLSMAGEDFSQSDGSSVWACAIRSDGEAVDCFLPSDAYSSSDGMIPVRATYFFPSPAPSMQPSINSLPTVSMAPSPAVPTSGGESVIAMVHSVIVLIPWFLSLLV